MLLSEITKIVGGKKLWDFDDKNCGICGATDMVSELLAIGKDDILLITGLTTPQMIKAADIVRVGAILVVRGKDVTPQFVELSKEYKIPLIGTKLFMFAACGKLFCAGLSDVNGNRYGN